MIADAQHYTHATEHCMFMTRDGDPSANGITRGCKSYEEEWRLQNEAQIALSPPPPEWLGRPLAENMQVFLEVKRSRHIAERPVIQQRLERVMQRANRKLEGEPPGPARSGGVKALAVLLRSKIG